MFKKSIVSIAITIITISILFTIFAIILCSSNIEGNKSEVNTISNCEHDWVVTSKYDFFRESYKTITKCSKCGKEV